MNTILVTGAAGFIGSRVSEYLINSGYQVIGLDNLNDYYDVRLKEKRLERLRKQKCFKFHHIDIEDYNSLEELFKQYPFIGVINEAARAGIRMSVENPFVYHKTNIEGNLNLLELCKKYKIQQYVLASTSSIYSGCEQPFNEESRSDTPYSPYAATKKSAELLAHSYYYLYNINIAIMRYFTVYGPFGRPDMGIFRFIKWILEGKKIQIYGNGMQVRDFTYIDDIAAGTIMALKLKGFHKINLGNNNPASLMQLISFIEKYTGKTAELEFSPSFPEDMESTCADIYKAEKILGWKPAVSLEKGIEKTVKWMMENWDWIKYLNI